MPTPICGCALWGTMAGFPFVLLFPLAPTANLVAALLVPVVFFMSMPFGVAPAAIQQMMPNTMRGAGNGPLSVRDQPAGHGARPDDRGGAHRKGVSGREVGPSFAAGRRAQSSFTLAIVLLWAGLKPYRRSLDHLARTGGTGV